MDASDGFGQYPDEFDLNPWETSRNDHRMGDLTGVGDPIVLNWVRVENLDRQWTINGRPRETSRTRVRTFRESVLRTR